MNTNPTTEGDLLKSVSRSFYLSMAWLPEEMRPGISLAYLLARATDSVADTSTASSDRRLDTLRLMGRAVAGECMAEELAELRCRLGGAMADAQLKSAEKTLLQRFGECLEMLATLPPRQVELIRRVLAIIIEGQCRDLTIFDTCSVLQSEEETWEYTYMVAGCVGEFWTELGYETLGERYASTERRELMIQAGVRFGRGLQLINILRDIREDAERGRSYLFGEERIWQNRAERLLRDGLDYAGRLRGFRLRFAVALPALLGLSTLRLIRRRKNQARVKVPRRKVYLLMLRAAWFSAWRRAS